MAFSDIIAQERQQQEREKQGESPYIGNRVRQQHFVRAQETAQRFCRKHKSTSHDKSQHKQRPEGCLESAMRLDIILASQRYADNRLAAHAHNNSQRTHERIYRDKDIYACQCLRTDKVSQHRAVNHRLQADKQQPDHSGYGKFPEQHSNSSCSQ